MPLFISIAIQFIKKLLTISSSSYHLFLLCRLSLPVNFKILLYVQFWKHRIMPIFLLLKTNRRGKVFLTRYLYRVQRLRLSLREINRSRQIIRLDRQLLWLKVLRILYPRKTLVHFFHIRVQIPFQPRLRPFFLLISFFIDLRLLLIMLCLFFIRAFHPGTQLLLSEL